MGQTAVHSAFYRSQKQMDNDGRMKELRQQHTAECCSVEKGFHWSLSFIIGIKNYKVRSMAKLFLQRREAKIRLFLNVRFALQPRFFIIATRSAASAIHALPSFILDRENAYG